MHHSVLIPLHVMAGKTAIATIHCTMILGQHILIQSIAIITKFLPYLKNVLEMLYGVRCCIFLLNKDIDQCIIR